MDAVTSESVGRCCSCYLPTAFFMVLRRNTTRWYPLASLLLLSLSVLPFGVRGCKKCVRVCVDVLLQLTSLVSVRIGGVARFGQCWRSMFPSGEPGFPTCSTICGLESDPTRHMIQTAMAPRVVLRMWTCTSAVGFSSTNACVTCHYLHPPHPFVCVCVCVSRISLRLISFSCLNGALLLCRLPLKPTHLHKPPSLHTQTHRHTFDMSVAPRSRVPQKTRAALHLCISLPTRSRDTRAL